MEYTEKIFNEGLIELQLGVIGLISEGVDAR